jgi:SWIM zinc finger
MNERTGALLAAAWSAAVTASAEPARFRRGREYLRENAVVTLDVLPGQLIGVVQGSRAEAYEVVVSVPGVSNRSTTAAQLVPGPRDLRYRCSCPDWDDPCKHAVAVALAFGERLRYAPDELSTLRHQSDPHRVEPVRREREPAGPAPGVRRGHLQLVSTSTASEPETVDPAIVEFLGTGLSPINELPTLDPLILAAPDVGAVPIAAVVNDAVSWLAAAYPTRR